MKNITKKKKRTIEIAYFSWADPIGFVFGLAVSIVAKVVDHQYSAASLARFEPHLYVQTGVDA